MNFYPKMGPASQDFKDAFEGWTIVEMGHSDRYITPDNETIMLQNGLTFILVDFHKNKKRLILESDDEGLIYIKFQGYI